MMKVLILVAIITMNHINISSGINGLYGKTILRCNSVPNLSSMYNTTNCDNNIISYCEFKSAIKNKYRRNMYLRSKEKYNYDANK
jgi:hypothetical protein